MRMFIALLAMVLLFFSYDTMALNGRYQSGLLSTASGYGAAARQETRGVFRRHGL